MKRSFFMPLMVAGAVLMLTACSTIMESGMKRRVDSTLTQSSYAAADMLIQQSRSFVSPDMPLAIGTLSDMDHPNETTNFGRLVTQQISSRFVQLGFNVTGDDNSGAPVPAMNAPNNYGSAYNGQAMPQSAATISGHYAVAREAVLVHLRILDSANGKVLASYDYNVPKTPDIRELTKTAADKNSFFDF